MTISLTVLTSCATKPVRIKPDVNFELFPDFPEPYDCSGNLVYYLTKSGYLDVIVDRDEHTKALKLDGGEYYILVPEWYWQYVEDFHTDYIYAVKTLRLHCEGDP